MKFFYPFFFFLFLSCNTNVKKQSDLNIYRFENILFNSNYENFESFLEDFEKYLETKIEAPSFKLNSQDRIFEGIVNRLDVLSDFKKMF